VHHSDPRAARLDDDVLREALAQGGLVHVPEDRLDGRPERAKLLEDGGRDDVARVEDEVRLAEAADTLVGDPARAARQVRVGDDGDEGRQRTRNGRLIRKLVRLGFIPAATRIA
jgi:hypothetical protein